MEGRMIKACYSCGDMYYSTPCIVRGCDIWVCNKCGDRIDVMRLSLWCGKCCYVMDQERNYVKVPIE